MTQFAHTVIAQLIVVVIIHHTECYLISDENQEKINEIVHRWFFGGDE
jgi:hypothetical protein